MPDLLDGMFHYGRIGLEKEKYRDKVNQYPNDVQDILFEFLKLWQIPEHAVPGMKEKQYSKWILDLRSLREIIEGYQMKAAMKNVFDDYSKLEFLVSSPGAILKSAISTIAKMNREKQKQDAEVENLKQEREIIANDDKSDAIKNLKSLREILKKD